MTWGSQENDIFYGAGLLNIKKALKYTGWPIDISSEILILARNKTNFKEEITYADPETGVFSLNLSRGTWTITASYQNYRGEIEISVPGDNDIVIGMH